MPAPHPLDNPIWSALTSRHSHLAQGDARARRYPENIDPIGALVAPNREAWEELAPLIATGGVLYLASAGLDDPAGAPPAALPIRHRAVLIQMMCERGCPAEGDEIAQMTLGNSDSGEMVALAELTQPGPFRTRTHTLGTFFGIRIGARLAAMAGMRFDISGYREISGVCTHPEFVGRGFARQLVARLTNLILTQGQTPFLHVDSTNARARSLYAHMGFVERAALPMMVVGHAS